MSKNSHSCITRSGNPCPANHNYSGSRVFIIGPSDLEFSSDIDKVKEVVEGFSLEPYFAVQSEKEAGEEVFCNKICRNIVESAFCIVILNDPIAHQCPSDKLTIRSPRPNVYYEYGLAIAFRKKTIPIARKGIGLPFDVQHLQTILYKDLDDLQQQLRPAIKGTIEKIAQEKERAQLEAQVIITDNNEPTETTIASRKENAQYGAILCLLLMAYLPFRLADYWIFNAGLSDWFNAETFVFLLVFLSILLVGRLVLAHRLSDNLIKLVQRLNIPYVLVYLLFMLALTVMISTIYLYPESTRVFFQSIWQGFFLLNLAFLLFAIPAFLLFNIPISRYSLTLQEIDYEPNPKKEFTNFRKSFYLYIKIASKKLPLLIILTTLVLTAVIVPLDVNLNLFTPSYIKNGETISLAYPFSASDEICLFIYSNWTGPSNITSDYRFYRLAQTQYTLFPAKLPLSSNISISNPTNITAGVIEQPNNQPNSYELEPSLLNENLGSVYVNISQNIEFDFIPNINNFTAINCYIPPKNSGFLTVNMTYWKKVDPNIWIITLPSYSNLGNGTVLEKYTYLIDNAESLPLSLQSLYLDRLNWSGQGVNANTTTVFFNGTNWFPSSQPFFSDYDKTINLKNTPYIEPGSTLNLTLTFESSESSFT